LLFGIFPTTRNNWKIIIQFHQYELEHLFQLAYYNLGAQSTINLWCIRFSMFLEHSAAAIANVPTPDNANVLCRHQELQSHPELKTIES
jgi:hypothetical protein